MSERVLVWRVLACLLLAAACGSPPGVTPPKHDPPSGVVTPGVPRNVAVGPGDVYGLFRLSWDPLDGLAYPEVQAQVRDGGWQPARLLPGRQAEVDDCPELTPVGFRVRAKLDSATGTTISDWSAPVVGNSGFPPPQLLDPGLPDGYNQLGWPPRPDADALRIDRADDAPEPLWSLLASVSPSPGLFVDTTAVENHVYLYRLRWVKGVIDFYGAITNPTRTPLYPPDHLEAVSTAHGVDLSWANRSQLATELVVTRSNDASDSTTGDVLAYLPPATTQYTDPDAAPGAHTYRVEARAPLTTFGGRNVQVLVPPPPSSGTWTTGLVELPDGVGEVEMDAQGRLVFQHGAAVDRTDHPAWAPLTPVQTSWASPPIVLDAADRIHIVYTGTQSDVYPIIHAWLDGQAWQTEELMRGAGFARAFALDASGHPVVATSAGPPSTIAVLSWDGSRYQYEHPDPTLPDGTYIVGLWLDASPDGRTHLVTQTLDKTVYAWRTATWTSETVDLAPGSPYQPGVATPQGIFATGGDAVSLFTYIHAEGPVALMRRDSSGWGPSTPLLTALADGVGPLLARSPDGTRLALLANTAGGLAFAESTDGWTPHALGPAAMLLGFQYGSSGRLVAVVGVGRTRLDYSVRAAVYRQQ